MRRRAGPAPGRILPGLRVHTIDPDDPASLCGACRLDPPPWSRLVFHGPYEGRLRDFILAYKFNGGLHRGRILADMLVRAFRQREIEVPDLLVPVPLHPKRLMWRGYNQSLELVRPLARALDRPVRANALCRIRNTPPQTNLNRGERVHNLKGAFEADPDAVRGLHVLLTDDVCTTGTTLEECAKALKRAGAAKVDGLVLAKS